jgi:hypothetical protein
MKKNWSIKAQAVGDLALIAFYYILKIGEYTVKGKWNSSKQTVQFKLNDVTFFKKNKWGNLVCLQNNAPYSLLVTTDSATLKLANQKSGGKGYVSLRRLMGKQSTVLFEHWCDGWSIHVIMEPQGRHFLSGFYVDGKRQELIGKDICKGLKMAATLLQYPTMREIPIACIDMLLLWSKGANALALFGYTDTQFQKMGRWKGATFKEYIWEEMAYYSTGMSTSMKWIFKFVNISSNAFHDVTHTCMTIEYNINCAAAS